MNEVKKLKINRETYKKIKKMDHREMEDYLTNLHAEGYNQGVNAITKIITDKIIKGLENTKGIGEKRMSDIIANINKEIEKD